jgi:predicted TIM-barrel fold metal-dependent hydrolase
MDQGEELQFLLQLPFLTDSDKEKICFSNAARLLELNEVCGALHGESR